MSQNFEELSDLYIRGEMSQEDRFAFEQMLNKDLELKNSLERKIIISQRLANNYKKSKLKSWHTLEQKRTTIKRSFHIVPFWLLSIAACIIVIIGVALYVRTFHFITSENLDFEILPSEYEGHEEFDEENKQDSLYEQSVDEDK